MNQSVVRLMVVIIDLERSRYIKYQSLYKLISNTFNNTFYLCSMMSCQLIGYCGTICIPIVPRAVKLSFQLLEGFKVLFKALKQFRNSSKIIELLLNYWRSYAYVQRNCFRGKLLTRVTFNTF